MKMDAVMFDDNVSDYYYKKETSEIIFSTKKQTK